jgi:hypothetical protein
MLHTPSLRDGGYTVPFAFYVTGSCSELFRNSHASCGKRKTLKKDILNVMLL